MSKTSQLPAIANPGLEGIGDAFSNSAFYSDAGHARIHVGPGFGHGGKHVETYFGPGNNVGTALHLRRGGADKYEIVVRNYFDTIERRGSYTEHGAQEVKIETLDGYVGASNSYPYKIRIYDRFSEGTGERRNLNIYWDSDQDWEQINHWNISGRGFVSFPDGINYLDMYERLRRFALKSFATVAKGRMPDFSELNRMTGVTNFCEPPERFYQTVIPD